MCFHESSSSSGFVSVTQHLKPAVSPQVLTTPIEVTSLDSVRRRSTSSIDETLTNQNLTLILSPAPSITPTTPPTTCDIVSIPSDIITCPATTKEKSPGRCEDPGCVPLVFFSNIKYLDPFSLNLQVLSDVILFTVLESPVGAQSSSFVPPTSSSSPLAERTQPCQSGNFLYNSQQVNIVKVQSDQNLLC